MDAIKDFFSYPFVWGLSLGLLFFVLSFWGHFKTKREYRRYRRHLSDKLELEARQYEVIRKEKEVLTKENENLRLRVGQLNEKPDQKVLRDMEIMTRAEKRMMIQAPGFAGAWEAAKSAAAEEVTAEDQGRSLPKRLFSRLFGTGSRDALPAEAIATSPSNGSEAPPATVSNAPEPAVVAGSEKAV
ncbi:MAG TPA: hypothetical protein VG796_30615 [Verrucomicrobiales bacterium]|nr:hypothetical protein [Verrucomicrobiales bacterium]